jgi:branched-chain amino acid transport system ATP-binding protein
MTTPRLAVRSLSKHFGGLVAVDEVSLEIAAGERVGLIGPNGAGKTTLFALIAGEIEADAGEILLDGRHLEKLASHRRARRGIARTYQHLEVFPEMTVLEHLLVAQSAHRGSIGVARDLLGRGRPTAEELGRAEAVLERLGLSDRSSMVVGTMSLGSCRLVELARALVSSPTLLLSDEPSSGLDTYESQDIAALLVELSESQGLSIAMVEHDLAMVRAVSDRVIVLDLGRVIASGSYDEVMSVEIVRHAYLGVDS